MKNKSARNIVEPAIFAALICILAPLSVPLPGGVPISLATFAIYVTAALLKPVKATLATVTYVALGLVGIPIFAGFTGGFEKLAGPTGGFIVGYVPCALVIALILLKSRRIYMYPIAMTVGTVFLYAVGLVWFMIALKADFAKAFSVTTLPFLAFDAVKIAVASALCCLAYEKLRKVWNK